MHASGVRAPADIKKILNVDSLALQAGWVISDKPGGMEAASAGNVDRLDVIGVLLFDTPVGEEGFVTFRRRIDKVKVKPGITMEDSDRVFLSTTMGCITNELETRVEGSMGINELGKVIEVNEDGTVAIVFHRQQPLYY